MRQAPFIEEVNATFLLFLTHLEKPYVNVELKSSTEIESKSGPTNSCHPIFSFIPAKDIRANMTKISPSNIPLIDPNVTPHRIPSFTFFLLLTKLVAILSVEEPKQSKVFFLKLSKSLYISKRSCTIV